MSLVIPAEPRPGAATRVPTSDPPILARPPGLSYRPAFSKAPHHWTGTHAADLDDLVTEMSNRLWDFAEIALEHQSAGYLAEVLEDEGFSVETGVAGMPACTPTP